jgi:hypothetical protein
LGFALTARNQKFNLFRNPLPEMIWELLIPSNELISRHGPEITYMSRELYLLKGLGVFPRSRFMLSLIGSGLGEFFQDTLMQAVCR